MDFSSRTISAFKSSERVTPPADARHKLERAGFGPGPYRFIGQEESKFQACHGAPVQPGTSCDYCGTGIIDTYWFKSAAGVVFKLGSDCMAKAAKMSDDYPLQTLAVKLKRAHNLKTRHAREMEKVAEFRAFLESRKDDLAALPHPTAWRAAKGETFLNYCQWMDKNAGTTGRLGAFREAKEALSQTVALW